MGDGGSRAFLDDVADGPRRARPRGRARNRQDDGLARDPRLRGASLLSDPRLPNLRVRERAVVSRSRRPPREHVRCRVRRPSRAAAASTPVRLAAIVGRRLSGSRSRRAGHARGSPGGGGRDPDAPGDRRRPVARPTFGRRPALRGASADHGTPRVARVGARRRRAHAGARPKSSRGR